MWNSSGRCRASGSRSRSPRSNTYTPATLHAGDRAAFAGFGTVRTGHANDFAHPSRRGIRFSRNPPTKSPPCTINPLIPNPRARRAPTMAQMSCGNPWPAPRRGWPPRCPGNPRMRSGGLPAWRSGEPPFAETSGWSHGRDRLDFRRDHSVPVANGSSSSVCSLRRRVHLDTLYAPCMRHPPLASPRMWPARAGRQRGRM